MARFCRKIMRVSIKWRILDGVSSFRRFFRQVWESILVYSTGKPANYRPLARRPSSPPPPPEEVDPGDRNPGGYDTDSDLVPLKISLLGDCRTGKTSFVIKFVGEEQERKGLQMSGLNLMDKTIFLRGARIAFSIWDVGGERNSLGHVPIACKDAVAILFMFDLTSRCTLQSVIGWYSKARNWNQTAILVLIGNKFDDFVRLPPDLQRTIVTQARAYARAMKAALFFSSATHNINVSKIFKFITAKLFDLPWPLQRNLTVGEPIVDFF
ncbi:hypothetical protein Nepgr_016258 [Nepenthes gracilis]|uniref:Septum-promoting GTP-binding protein 1 n=1 Tax=Nepenthes gracilis TaxID=150966 RepID=A0AAD3SPY1_NEPGR|nr:hypothetical protein Nepgr_016258 [Nepenthes gracilis]